MKMKPTGLRRAIPLLLGLTLAGPLAAAAHAEGDNAMPLDQLRTFAEVFGRIKGSYVEPVDDAKLLKDAIRGMLAGLDPHSSYLDSEEFKDLRVGTSGQFGGLGIEIGMEDGFVKVISPIDDTPAERAGIRAGDLIIRLDEQPVKGMSLDEAVKVMRGKPGTEITLTIIREGQDKPLKIAVERAIIKVASVKRRLLAPGFGYVRISQFQARTAEDMLKAIGKLKKASGGPLKGLVLDLRNNPGGVLNAAVAVSDAFLTEGLVVYTQGRNADSRMEFKAAPDDALDGAPLVVLVNGGSASASEIVAGALQDQKRAVIMGRQTFGKGSVQTIVPVNDTAAVKMTTARYYTPLGRSIQAEGVTPDIIIDPVEVKLAPKDKAHDNQVKEADLVHHLSNGKSGSKPDKEKPSTDDLVERDFMLNEALNLLKGMALLSRTRG